MNPCTTVIIDIIRLLAPDVHAKIFTAFASYQNLTWTQLLISIKL